MERVWEEFKPLWSQHGRALDAAFCQAAAQWKAAGCQQNHPLQRQTQNRPLRHRRSVDRPAKRTSGLGAIRASRNRSRSISIQAAGVASPANAVRTPQALAHPELQRLIAALWDGPVERSWRHCLRRGLQALRQRRQQQGVITFAGLLAMDPGESDEEPVWLQALRERYRTVMVDEFQDTDPVQWRLLHRAFAGRSSHLLLLVGDPKQAIYRLEAATSTPISRRGRASIASML